VAKKALPVVESAWRNIGPYQEFRKYSPAELARLQQPANANLGGQALLQAMEDVNKAQGLKADADRPVQLHNEQAWHLEYNYFRLCIIAGDATKDKDVMKYLVEKEKQKIGKDIPPLKGAAAVPAPFNGQWFLPAEAIKIDVKSLSKERARFYYDEFKKLGTERKWDVPSYIKWGEATTSRSDNSTYVPVPMHLGRYFMEIVNLLAPIVDDPAKAPAVQVPTDKEIDEHNKPPAKPTTPTPPHK
jgi:hypothetical protein